MDPPQIFGAKVEGEEEECNSCESGWTKYIGSPTIEYDDDGRSGGGDNNNGEYDHSYESISDDSMASDASSGPNHDDHRNTHNMVSFKHHHWNDEDDVARCSSRRSIGCHDQLQINHEEAKKMKKEKGRDEHQNKTGKEGKEDQTQQGSINSSSSSSWVWAKQGGSYHATMTTAGSRGKVRIKKNNDRNRMTKTN